MAAVVALKDDSDMAFKAISIADDEVKVKRVRYLVVIILDVVW